MIKKIMIGNRTPKEYFITSGTGESQTTIHAGSFDHALKRAGIFNYNIIRYSSIMPKDAVRIEKPTEREHGSVLECIIAETSGRFGDIVTAGLIIGWVYDKNTGKSVGGLVAEYKGNDKKEDAKKELEKMMNNMFNSRYDTGKFELNGTDIYIQSFVPKQKYGTAVVAICFSSYEVPVFETE